MNKKLLQVLLTFFVIANFLAAPNLFAHGGGGHGGGGMGGGGYHGGDFNHEGVNGNWNRNGYWGGTTVVGYPGSYYDQSCNWIPGHYDSSGYWIEGHCD